MKTIILTCAIIGLCASSSFAQGKLSTRLVSAATMYIPLKGNVLQTYDMGNTWIERTPEESARAREHASRILQKTGDNKTITPTALSLSPNPINDVVTAEFSCNETSPVRVCAISTGGHEHALWRGTAVAGSNRLTLSLGELPVGNYTIIIESSSGRSSVAAVVVR